MQLNKSLNLQSEACVEGKHSTIRPTGMAAANGMSDLPMIIISKSKSPRFREVKHSPCSYRDQSKSCMDSVFFEEWIQQLNRKFTKENNKVELNINNYPQHPTTNSLKPINFIFLTPNTTDKLQTVDQGVMRPLKVYLNFLTLHRLVVAFSKGKDPPVFFILEAMKKLDLAWQKVEASTIVNCFAKAGISKD